MLMRSLRKKSSNWSSFCVLFVAQKLVLSLSVILNSQNLIKSIHLNTLHTMYVNKKFTIDFLIAYIVCNAHYL